MRVHGRAVLSSFEVGTRFGDKLAQRQRDDARAAHHGRL